MKTRFISMLIVGLLSFGISVTDAAVFFVEKHVSPTINELLTNDIITGILMKPEGEFYSIKDNDGMVYRIHVDRSTKADPVIAGDMVKAYVMDENHATTLQRNNYLREEDERVSSTDSYSQ
jgi:hypothetical protein